MSELLEHALQYAGRGWPIFPVRKNKRPYTDEGVLQATTNKKRILAWWEKWPNANIGVDVGRMGMMVIDLDPGHDLGELENVIGELPDTGLRQRTPRGGEHLFYEIDRDEVVPPSASKLSQHVDVRSFHSYVLLYPSKTKDGEYSWEEQGRPAFRSDGMIREAQREREKSSDADNWIIEPDLEENINACIDWLKNKAEIAIEGLNGDQMAYNTAAMCKSFGVSPETALELMWEHWSPRCSPPWDASELEHLEQKVTNGYTYNTSPPGNMTAGYKVAKAQEMFKPVSRDTKGGGKETLIGRFRFIDRAGMGEIKPPEWLITDCLPQGSYSLLIGPRGTFKTFVALDMALSVATGAREYYEDGAWEWTGPWPSIGKTGKVLFAAGEGRGNIVNRVKAWEKYHLDGDEVENFTLVDPVPHPTTEDVTPFIEGALERSKDGYDLVVMDTVGRSMQGLNENSQQDVSMFTQMVQEVQANLKCAVLAIHHTGHENAMRGRGSSVFGADVDAEFVLDREEGEYLVALTNTKQKDAPEWEQPHVIKLRELNVGKKTKSLVACNPNNAEKTKATAHKNKGSKRGRKSKLEKVENMKIVKKAAIDLMREYPNKEFTNNALAEGIMADSKISLSKTTCVTYVGEFLIDSTHPITKCYDRGRRIWTYVK